MFCEGKGKGILQNLWWNEVWDRKEAEYEIKNVIIKKSSFSEEKKQMSQSYHDIISSQASLNRTVC